MSRDQPRKARETSSVVHSASPRNKQSRKRSRKAAPVTPKWKLWLLGLGKWTWWAFRYALRGVGWLFRALWKIVVTVSIVGGLGGLYYVWPLLDVAPRAGYERVDDPMTVALSLINDGYLPVTIDRITAWVYYWVNEKGEDVRAIAYDYDGSGKLYRRESADFTPDPPIQLQGKPLAADFLVVVDYHQEWWKGPLQKRIRFDTKRGDDGMWIWNRPYLTEADRHMSLDPKSTTHLRYVPTNK